MKLTTILLLVAVSATADSGPARLCYSAQPNPYFDDHAGEVKKIYDGLFFVVGSWEQAADAFTGSAPKRREWLAAATRNIASLRKAGVTENFLGVSFNQDGAWPSPETLLSESFARNMSVQFGALGRVAREVGFRGVCIDVEYPYPRYELSNPIYTYSGYTADELLEAAYKEGRRSMAALLDEFPEAVIIVLPGELRTRPIARKFMLGMLDLMAERDAPGGLHLGTEYTYCLSDPLSTIAASRSEDPAIGLLSSKRTADYWRRRCTMAPGVWPLHMVETEAQNYPVQPWEREAADLRDQMAQLRAVAKRYIWSFTGTPVWYIHTPELEINYGLKKQSFKLPDIILRDWHSILEERPVLPPSSPWAGVVEQVKRFDQGALTGEELCDAFGTPGRWWVLGILSNPRTQPAFADRRALDQPVESHRVHHGRDGAVRWFAYDNLDPRGITDSRRIFDWRNTDFASAHFVTFVHSPERRRALLHVGWDDGILIKLSGKTVFDQMDYPLRGKGILYLDKYRFEKHIPITLEKGRNRLAVTSVNSRGAWVFTLRITDERGVPFPDVHFRLK